MRKARIFFLFLGIFLFAFSVANAQETIAQLKDRIIDIQNTGELGFRNFTLCTNIIGYGQYVPAESNKVKAGSEVYFYYEPVNLYTNRRSNTYQIWFTQDMILQTQDGKEIYRGSEALNFNSLTTSPVLDVYATNSLNLGDLPPGKYRFLAAMHDKLKKVDASHSFDFEIIL
ncbi:MAG: hypothetical protein ABIL68_04325 [bacterium]